MTATLINSGTFGFNDGNGGHVIDLGSAPNANEVDVLCVNSNTVVTTPTGFTAAPTRVNSQGAYVYRRKAVGGEGQTVTITTSGNHETAVGWSRWGGINAADDTASSGVDGVSGTSTPAHSTGTLAASTELIIAFGALHSLSALPSSPVWAGAYTALTAVTQGSGSSGVTNYVGYKQPVGTAAESPSVSWTGNVSDRYMLTITFTIAGGQSAAVGTATETDSAIAVGRLKTRAVGLTSETDASIALGRRKTRALGIASATDAAIALARAKARALGLATSTEVALPLGRRKARALGIAAELDTAVHLTGGGGAVRDLVLVVGPPETKWSTGRPGAKWSADRPGQKWTTSRPEV